MQSEILGIARSLPMKPRNFGSESAKGGGNGVKFDLFNLGLGLGIGGILVDHVV